MWYVQYLYFATMCECIVFCAGGSKETATMGTNMVGVGWARLW